MKTGSVTSPRPLPDGRVLFAWSSLQRPAELYLAGLDGGEGKRITKLNDDQIVALRLGKVGSFSFIGEKGRTVHGRLIYPAAFDSNRKYPVVFVIHGGPETSNLNEFNYRWNLQIFAEAGYAVIAIDYPGSTGYGQAFFGRCPLQRSDDGPFGRPQAISLSGQGADERPGAFIWRL
jgi:dipeptidyl aminopeptidase/acylaminoacyl peptidase